MNGPQTLAAFWQRDACDWQVASLAPPGARALAERSRLNNPKIESNLTILSAGW